MPETQTQPVSQQDVIKAKAELKRMRTSLKSWLKYRRMNDEVAMGTRASRLPKKAARTIISQGRDWAVEQKLATQLHALLSELEPEAALPVPNVTANPNAAVELAQIAINGPTQVASPQAQGFVWLWPVLIVGGLLLAVTTAIRSMADVAKEREHYECIKAGACTDYGFWLKIGGAAALGWFIWTQTGVGQTVKRYITTGRRS